MASTSRAQLARLFPPNDIDCLFSSLANALEPKTQASYGAGLLRFTQYCDARGIPEAAHMPADEPLLAMFVAQYVGVRQATYIANWLAGLAFWHTMNLAPWRGDCLLRSLKQAAVRMAPDKKDKRPPVTVEHLHALRAGLDLADAFDAAVWAVACVAFWGCRRLGQLVVPSRNSFDQRRHVARGVEMVAREEVGGVRPASFKLPLTKTTRSQGATVSLTETDPRSSAVCTCNTTCAPARPCHLLPRCSRG